MHAHRRLALVTALFALSCGGTRGGEVLRPADPKATDALAEPRIACEDPLGYGEPLVVDWSSNQRLDLEVAMRDGLVPVRYTCGEFRVVKGCKVAGDYAFAGVSRKEDVIRIENAAEVQANFRVNVASLEAAMSRGSTIDLAVILVGKFASTATMIERDALVGGCDDATHVVGGAMVGAFAMATGSAGQVNAAAEVFKLGGASGATSSNKQALSRDGDIEACASSSARAPEPPEECGSAIRVELLPIVSSAKGPSAAPPAEALPPDPCQEGFTLVDGKCSQSAKVAARQCAWKDAADCQAQCEKGSLASCYNFAYTIEDQQRRYDLYEAGCKAGFLPSCHMQAFYKVFGIDKASTPEMIAAGMKEFDENCFDRGYADSCAQAARLLSGPSEVGPQVRPDPKHSVELYERGCDLGDGINSCPDGAKMVSEGKAVAKDPTAARRMWSRGCTARSGQSCRELGDRLRTGKDGLAKDPVAALDAYRRGCDVEWESCEALGDAYAAGVGLDAPDLAKAKEAYGIACEWTFESACKKLKKLK